MSALISLATIRADVQAQPRSTISTDLVAEYAEAMGNGAEFPALVVFREGEVHWLADGFHRFYAYQGCERAAVECDVREGTLRDAVLYSVGANASHGLRRTTDDKRRAVAKLLDDPEWSKWSDREIARRCGVDNKTVSAARPVVQTEEIPQYQRTYTHPKTGKPTTMNTAAIGRSAPRPVSEPPTAPPPPDLALHEEALRLTRESLARGDVEIYHSIDEVVRIFEHLPDPQAAVRDFPPHLRHPFTAERFAEIAEWFRLFSQSWSEIDAVAAE